MTHSTRWLAPFALGAALSIGAPSTPAQDDAQTRAPAEPAAKSPAEDAGGAEAAAADGAARDRAAENAAARADDLDRTPRDCVILSDIRQTVVLDDRTILFYMRGGKKTVYRNYLPNQCPNLAREGRFAYQVPVNRLCSVDLITVLEQFGPSLGPGFTCRLGSFYPVTFEEAEILRKDKDHPEAPRGDAIKAQPAEPSPEKTGAAAAPATESPPASPNEAAPTR
jgi:hypothetical protein